jgi:crossover junction endodeoxyribonuclease RuvC
LIIVGVDPGTAVTGYGVVAQAGGGAVSLLECGVIRTDAAHALPQRLRDIYEGVADVLGRHDAQALAIESVFYGRNVRTTVVLGHARAAAMLAGALRGLPVAEYSPAEVKNAIAGTGRATKEQVQYMVQQLLQLRAVPQPADAADGIAVALCHCQSAALLARLSTVVR